MDLKEKVVAVVKRKGRSMRWLSLQLEMMEKSVDLSLISGNIKFSNLIRICKILDVPLSYFDPGNKSLIPESPSDVKVLSITVDSGNNENIVFVPAKASAGYAEGYGDPEFISKLPTISIPYLHGTYRCFEVRGDSMENTLFGGDMIVGEHVEKLEWIRNDEIYIIVADGGIMVKRAINNLKTNNTVILRSDNTFYKDQVIPAEEIKEVWKAEFRVTKRFGTPSTDIIDKLGKIEAEIEQLKNPKS